MRALVTLLFLTTMCSPLPAQLLAMGGSGQERPFAVGIASGQVKDPLSQPHNSSYVIGDADLLEINVWNEAGVSRTVPVRSDGKISLPLAGELQAAGLTPLQLEEEITKKLRSYITAPDVTVMVQKINSEKFNIMGEVIKPGAYPLTVTMRVMDAIATAGGLRDFAKKTGIYVLRQSPDGREQRIRFNYKTFIRGKNPSQNVLLQPGDTVVVP
jgi:polysaccharide export outer membrane protein